MREIKFKVWDTNIKKFIKDFYIGEEKRCDKNGIFDIQDDGHSYIFLQFTGLKDKNGLDIYEGDVIKGFADFTENDKDVGFEAIYEFTDVVKYQGCGFYCENADFPLDQYQKLEIIGNLFQNPELLAASAQ